MTTSAELVPVDVDARAAEVERQVAEARAKAEAMQVSNDAELGAAATLLREFANRKKAADELRKELTKPLRDHLADLKKRFDDAAAPYDEADRVLREKAKDYQAERERIRQEEEARLERERQERERQAREERERQEADEHAKREQAEKEAREAAEEAQAAKDEEDRKAAETLAEEARQKAEEAKTAEEAIASLPEPTLPKAVVPTAPKPEGLSSQKRWDFEVTNLAALPTHLPDGEALIEVRSGPLRRYMHAYLKEHGRPPEMAGVEFKQVDGLAVRG
jgi:exonuclease VII large subunit